MLIEFGNVIYLWICSVNIICIESARNIGPEQRFISHPVSKSIPDVRIASSPNWKCFLQQQISACSRFGVFRLKFKVLEIRKRAVPWTEIFCYRTSQSFWGVCNHLLIILLEKIKSCGKCGCGPFVEMEFWWIPIYLIVDERIAFNKILFNHLINKRNSFSLILLEGFCFRNRYVRYSRIWCRSWRIVNISE